MQAEAASSVDLYAAVNTGDAKKLEALLAEDAWDVLEPESEEGTVESLDGWIMPKLVAPSSKLCDGINELYGGETLLMRAVKRSNAHKLVAILLSYGADPLSVGSTPINMLPIHHAVRRNNVTVLDLLTKQERIKAAAWKCSDTGEAEQNRNRAASYSWNTADSYGWTPLHYAASVGNSVAIAWLLRQPGIRVGARNRFGELPIHQAAGCGCLKVVKQLLQALTEPVAVMKGASSPLCWAVERGRTKVVKYLLHHASGEYSLPESCGSLLHEAAKRGSYKLMALCYRKGDENKKNHLGDTPLHVAADHGNIAACRYLLEKKANKNLYNGEGLLPCHVAAYRDNIEFLTILGD